MRQLKGHKKRGNAEEVDTGRQIMVDNYDPSRDTLNLLVWQALRQWGTEALFPLLKEEDNLVRTAVARELQIRGGNRVFEEAMRLASHSSAPLREIAAFILGQLEPWSYPYKDKSLDTLLHLMSDDDADVRAAAAAACGYLYSGGMPETVEKKS